MKTLLLFITFLFLTFPANATIYLNWGAAFGYPGPSVSFSDVQNYAIGTQQKLDKRFDYIVEGGYWKDGSKYPGAQPSLYFATGIGLDLKLHERYVSYFIGPSYISQTDSLLGSNFEVFHKFSFGVRDYRNERIGFFIKHLSDGGLTAINQGRNFFGLEASF
jgi:hypothetical protein